MVITTDTDTCEFEYYACISIITCYVHKCDMYMHIYVLLITVSDDRGSGSECPLGCLVCSRWNGCNECITNFTWHVKKIYMRTIGLCLQTCPQGYFKREFYAPGHYRCEGLLNKVWKQLLFIYFYTSRQSRLAVPKRLCLPLHSYILRCHYILFKYENGFGAGIFSTCSSC